MESTVAFVGATAAMPSSYNARKITTDQSQGRLRFKAQNRPDGIGERRTDGSQVLEAAVFGREASRPPTSRKLQTESWVCRFDPSSAPFTPLHQCHSKLKENAGHDHHEVYHRTMAIKQHALRCMDVASVRALEALARAYTYGLAATFGAGLCFAGIMYIPLVLRMLLGSH